MKSRFLFATHIFFILFLFVFNTVAMAEGISWTLHQTSTCAATVSSESDTLHIIISDQGTEISSQKDVLFVDYSNMLLYRLDRSTKQCVVFDLKEKEPVGTVEKTTMDANVVEQNNLFLAEFIVNASDEWQEIKNLQCNKKTVLSGAGMFRLKTVAPKVLKRYGQSFSEAQGEYWVSTDVDVLQELQKAVQQRQTAFAAVPLLKRIDPLGIIEAVGGFPVRGWQKSGGIIVEQLLVSGPVTGDFLIQAPQACGDLEMKKGAQ